MKITKRENDYGLLAITLDTDRDYIFETIDDAVVFVEKAFYGHQYTAPTAGIFCMSCFVDGVEITEYAGERRGNEKIYYERVKLSIFNFGKRAAVFFEGRSEDGGNYRFFLDKANVSKFLDDAFYVVSAADEG